MISVSAHCPPNATTSRQGKESTAELSKKVFSLTRAVLLTRVRYFIEAAVADEAAVRNGEVGALGHDGLLHLHHL